MTNCEADAIVEDKHAANINAPRVIILVSLCQCVIIYILDQQRVSSLSSISDWLLAHSANGS